RASATTASPGVDDEEQYADADAERADGGGEVAGGPTRVARICIDAARHPDRAEVVLGEEREIEAGEHHPELDSAEPLAEQATRHLRPPVVGTREEPEEAAADQHVVQVSDDEVAVRLLQVDGR